MKIMNGVKNLRIKCPTAVAVGMFDGVHRGHKKILLELKKWAKNISGKSCVLTFDTHPAKILHPRRRPPMLISTKHKLNLLAAMGIDIAVLMNFTKDFAKISPERFVKEILVRRLNTKELLAGRSFVFGRHGSGNIKTLRMMGGRLGFRARSVSPLKTEGEVISSTLIRKLIMSGDLGRAKKMLGREVAILGTVTEGAGRGKALGYPTANLDLHHEAIPPGGVYIVKLKLDNKNCRGVLNIGSRPTFDGGRGEKEPIAEVHIFGLKRSIYGKDAEVIFLKRIRRERKFKNVEHLRQRIKIDVDIARAYFRKIKGDVSPTRNPLQ